MKSIVSPIGLIIIGILIGHVISVIIEIHRYVIPMKALGIERFQRCEINTTNCHSNWYEIVYKSENN